MKYLLMSIGVRAMEERQEKLQWAAMNVGRFYVERDNSVVQIA